ncbi:MAG: hypothetical protein K0S18_1664 [Anaerocolumna sp.]|nr:hypothetical protein [Anaerocolumna sp.]
MEQGISKEELIEVIQSTIQKKPRSHQFGEVEETKNEDEITLEERRMSQIGG